MAMFIDTSRMLDRGGYSEPRSMSLGSTKLASSWAAIRNISSGMWCVPVQITPKPTPGKM